MYPSHTAAGFIGCSVEGNDPASEWTSTSHGKPGGVGATGMPSLHWDNADIYIFTRTLGGRMFVRSALGAFNDPTPSWTWTNAGRPPGAIATSDPGSTSYGGKQYAFVVGDDQRLYGLSGPSWVWSQHGTPGVGLVGRPAVVSYLNSNLYVYVVGADGQLYLRYWNGVFWNWSTIGAPPGGVTLVGSATALTSGTSIDIFVGGANEHVYRHFWDGSTWQWTDQGLATAGIGVPDSARFGNTPNDTMMFAPRYLSHASTQPTLLGNQWNSATHTWEIVSHGAPAGQTLYFRQPAIAASFISMPSDGWRVSVFAMAKGDRVYRRWYGPGSHGIWSWTWSTKYCQM